MTRLMPPPAVTITLALEATPVVVIAAEREGDEARLRDWVMSRPELAALVGAALALSRDATPRGGAAR